MPAKRGTSLELHLLSWVLGALALGSAALVLAVYLIFLDEMGEVFDESLRQVAIVTAARDDPDSIVSVRRQLPTLPKRIEETTDFEFVTSVYARDGSVRYSSDPAAVVPRGTGNGPSKRVAADGTVWHVYSIALDDRTVESAQRADSRSVLAAAAAEKLLAPVGLLIVLIAVLIIVALRRGLRPLDDASEQIAMRRAGSLDGIDALAMPREIRPMVDEINALMARLEDALQRQRLFVADAAHELRSPITALRLQVQLLERAADAPARDDAMRQARQGVQRLQRLVEQLLDLSKIEPGYQREPSERLDLRALAEEVVHRHAPQALAQSMQLSLLGDETVSVDGDGHELDILIDNLVGNAVRYAGAGATIRVIAACTGGRPTLTVSDTGSGIALQERERIFDRFYRGESLSGELRSSGSGLGLAIARAIAARHLATLELRPPRPGIGAEFVVTF